MTDTNLEQPIPGKVIPFTISMKTLIGLDLFEAFKRLDNQLPAGAYKQIQGGKGGKLGLTDIVPAFLPELLLELFGPIGLGWGFTIEEMVVAENKVERKGGYTDTEYQARCRLSSWYAYRTNDIIANSTLISATGASTNTQVEWAMKGAITNALGTAWFFAGYQLSVHKNERSHDNLQPELPKNPSKAILDAFKALGAPDLQVAYFTYVGQKYSISSIEEMSPERFHEQLAILNTCARNEQTRTKFIEMLRTKQPPPPRTEEEPNA